MSDVHVTVRSNLDALSAELLHEALKSMVKDSVREMRDFARTAAPKRTGLLAEHIEDEEISAVADLIEGKVGVKAVDEADGRRSSGQYRRSQYPLFVEGGTRTPIFAARTGGLMWNASEGIFGRHSVRGQRAHPFMAETYVQAQAILESDPAVRIAMETMAARAAAEAAAIESS